MDYIGIDAYFTVDTNKTSSLDSSLFNWLAIKNEIKSFSEENSKQIIFTEYGYRSADYSGFKPYAAHSDQVNLAAQANLYRSLYYTFWDESWFLGGFSWVWYFNNNQPEGYDNIDYTPQNKPAENILAKNYGRFKN